MRGFRGDAEGFPDQSGSHRRRAWAAVVLLAVIASLPTGAFGVAGAVGHWSVAPRIGTADRESLRSLVPAASSPTTNSSGPRTILADAPCNTSQNLEVAEASDVGLGYLYAAWVGCGGIGFARSVDGGYSFEPAAAVPGSTLGVASDPSVAVAPNGTVYVASILDNATGPAPQIAWSFDHGASFDGAATVTAPVTGTSVAKDSLGVAPNGTLVMTWIYSPDSSEDQQACNAAGDCWFTTGDLNPMLAESSDHGATWSVPIPLDGAHYPSAGVTAAPVAVAGDGAIDVLLEDHPVAGGHLLGPGYDAFVRSVDGGSNWTAPVNVSADTFPVATPWTDGSIAVGPNGTLSVAFDASALTADDAYLAASTTNGTTWSPALRLNPDADTAAHGHVTVAAGANGTAEVVWLTNNSSAGWRLYGANVSGNGSAVGAAVLLSTSIGLPTLPTGATLGVAALGEGAFAVAWSIGVTYDRLTAAQVLSTVVAETAPTDAPTITSVVPGAGQVSVGWMPPSSAADRVTGFVVVWGLLHQRTFYNLTYPKAATFAIVAGLPVDYAWYFEVAADNGAGAGPVSQPVNVTLQAFGIVRGSIAPANATVQLDGAAVSTANGSYLVNTTIGLHLLSASAPDHAGFVTPVNLPWNGTVYQNISLSLSPGAVDGSVSPLNATVLFDGAAVTVNATGRFAIGNVSTGEHVLAVTEAGFVGVTRNLTVVAGQTTWENVTLLRANGTLRLTVTPASALVRFNGTGLSLSAGGTVNVTVPPGVYVLNVSAPGFVAQQENVTILGASTVPLSIVLLKQPATGGSPTTGSGLPSFTGEAALAVAVIVVVAVAVGALIGRRRRQGPGPTEPGPAIWESDAADGGDEATPPTPEAPPTPPSDG